MRRVGVALMITFTSRLRIVRQWQVSTTASLPSCALARPLAGLAAGSYLVRIRDHAPDLTAVHCPPF